MFEKPCFLQDGESQSSYVTHVSESNSRKFTVTFAPRSYADMVWGSEGIPCGDFCLSDRKDFLDNKRVRSDNESSEFHADKRCKPEMDSQSQNLSSSPEDQRGANNVYSDEADCEDPNISIENCNINNMKNDNAEHINDIRNNTCKSPISYANEVDMNVNATQILISTLVMVPLMRQLLIIMGMKMWFLRIRLLLAMKMWSLLLRQPGVLNAQ